MHRTDAPGHVGNLHVDLNPPTPGTTVAAATLNASQEELCGLVEDLGIALVKGTNTQVKTAIRALFAMGRPSIAATVGSNALTVSIKNLKTGADAAAGSPIAFQFLDSAALNSSVPVEANLAAASSIVISSGSTMGAVNGVPFRLWLVMFKDGANLRPGLINCRNGTDIFPLGQFPIASSTAEGGAGGADSAHVFYTGVAVAAKAYVVLGYLEWQAGLAAAGTWNVAPTIVQLFGSNVPLPGQELQSARVATGAWATGTTVIPGDDTIPQNTEGDQYMSVSITPRAAANVLRAQVGLGGYSSGGAAGWNVIALFVDAAADTLAAFPVVNGAGTTRGGNVINHELVAGGVAARTFKMRAGPVAADTFSFNGHLGARVLGGTLNSYISVKEVQA